ncbi:ABC multidrug transporter-like protein [Phyllosticta citribraziliensis]|uniref:ABC multidrug transporter-like protein n=1 Tax=Phyllosticta citribraziliensis TaxID=989973 RepID=A0ABR1M4L7_9PEZI
MADPGREKQDWQFNATEAAATATTIRPDEPVATTPLDRVGTEKELNPGNNQTEDHKDPSATPRSVSEGSTDDVAETKSQTPKVDSQKREWSRIINPLKWGKVPAVPEGRTVSREYGASWFSRLTFQWMSPLMSVGYQRPLELNDIWLVNPDRSAEALSKKLYESFDRRVAAGGKRPLLGALYDTFKHDIYVSGASNFVTSMIQVLAPFSLRYLINFATEAYIAQRRGVDGPDIGYGMGLVVAVTGMQVIQSILLNYFFYKSMMIGGESRAVLISAIFDKAMRLSGRAKAGGKAPEKPPPDIKPGTEEERKWYEDMLKSKKNKKDAKKAKAAEAAEEDNQGWSNGRIVNLMSTDTYRVDLACGFGHMVWTSPAAIILTIALLLYNLTYSALAGIGLIVLTLPLLGKAMKSLFSRRESINKVTDKRVSLTQEILQAVRFVKYFGWESSFLNRLAVIRKQEVGMIQSVMTIRNGINAIGMSIPVFAAMLAFITYSLSQHVLTPAPIFSSLALFNSLRLPLNFLPLVLGQLVDALSSVKRIEEFLLAEEADEKVQWDNQLPEALIVKDANFTWEYSPSGNTKDVTRLDPKKAKKEQKQAEKRAAKEGISLGEFNGPPPKDEKPPFQLHDINLAIQRHELIAVIGTVGSGKSSLLGALAGDMRRTSGEVILGAGRAFCPQYAWIQNATVKENIIFGKPLRQEWYDAVVDACALRADFDMLPNGDQTEIGERGITVSGGQKQRLNIARAIYFETDVILMDDPLSAVDAHVGRHIMSEAICGLMRDKCRILATHQLHVLNRCDRIVLMDSGRITAIDTYDNLKENNEDFKKLLASTSQEGKKEEEEEEEEIEEEKKDVQKKVSKKPAAGLMQAEERAVKSVSWGVYAAYFKAGGSILMGPLVVFLLILSQGANIATSLWLSWWTSDNFGLSEGVYIGIYAGLGAAQALLMFAFSVVLSYGGTEASKVMLHRAMERVLRAPMSFFDTTPLGRITNRFSKDIDVMDNSLTDSMRMFLLTLAMISSIFALIIAYFHYFGIALAPLLVLFWFSAGYYRASAREVKRYEAVLRSTVFSRFSEAVNGVASIRAYGLQAQFSKSIRDAIDDMDSAYFLTFSNQRWLSIRLDAIGCVLVFITGLLVVTSRFNVSPSIAGLVLSYILSIVQMFQFSVRQLAEVENNMNATERVHYYGSALEQEAPQKLAPVRESWPESGEINFDNVQMRYRDGLPLVLRGLSMHVRPGERIGIVGRTGAGKSTIMSTLFRLVELSGGKITIDGVDIATIGLADLRSRLAIIPQDPTLFRGTIRSNLDPFNEHSDLELWNALRQADLVGQEASIEDRSQRMHLDSPVDEEGLNFSLGQRQLMALARALVRGARIIVCDEATSSVDMETDAKIQRTMAMGFQGRTLLCIAHRLRTIIGYDRICVMDKGCIAELGTPVELWDVEGGIFRSMCDRSGISREDVMEAAMDGGMSLLERELTRERTKQSMKSLREDEKEDGIEAEAPPVPTTEREPKQKGRADEGDDEKRD